MTFSENLAGSGPSFKVPNMGIAAAVNLYSRLMRRKSHIADTHVIAGIYRGLLNREPDPYGMACFIKRLQEQGSVEDIVRDVLNSAEFAQKPQ